MVVGLVAEAEIALKATRGAVDKALRNILVVCDGVAMRDLMEDGCVNPKLMIER